MDTKELDTLLDFDMAMFEARLMAFESLCQEQNDSHESFAERYGNIVHKESNNASSRH